jgi:hypothetical protein
MLEASKPRLRPGTERLHYLLATPFRYAPLPHGSRFGSRLEPSLFYGSRALTTALAEAAYYRFFFWSGMEEPPASGRLLTQHTAFGARYRTERGLRLQQGPCSDYEEILTDRTDYSVTQSLGRSMREAGIDAFEYISARDRARGINVALFGPRALVNRKPLWQQAWLCETRGEVVSFSASASREVHVFPVEWFLVAGSLPRPAA